MAVDQRSAHRLIFSDREGVPPRAIKGSSWDGRARLSYLFLLGSFAIFFQLGFMLAVNLGYSKMGLVESGIAGYNSMGPSVREHKSHSNNRKLSEARAGIQTSDYSNEHSLLHPDGSIVKESEVHIEEARYELVDQEPDLRNDSPVWLPDGWETYGHSDARRHFGCSAYGHDQTKPLPELQDWKLFQSKYREIVDTTALFDDPVPPTMGYTLGDDGPPPFYAGHSAEGRGRGLFASRDIKKGELTHDGTSSDIIFPDAMSWRRYIFSLPRDRACDMIEWPWTQQTEDGTFRIFAAINISVLFNGSSEAANINPTSSTSSKFYATRDIKRGEELLYDYRIYDTVWHKVGLVKRWYDHGMIKSEA